MTDNEVVLARRLQAMQRLATALVVAMAVVFVATSVWGAALPPLGVVRAFSEAALIGGLADWFAVTALFRHPLGLPIPHTAIVPSRKDEIGRALSRFIADHFLLREVIEPQLERVNLATRLGHWMQRPGTAKSLARDLSLALNWLLRGVDSGPLRDSVKSSLRQLADSIPPHRLLEAIVDVLASGDHAQSLIDQLVVYGRDQLERNHTQIRDRIRERSPWWLPRFVDTEIYDQLVGELQRILNEVGSDPDHPARAEFNERLRSLKYSFAHDAALIAKGESLRDEILGHPEVARFVAELWSRTRDYLEQALSDPDSPIRAGIESELDSIGKTLTSDDQINRRLDAWLREMIVYVVEHYREPMSQIVSTTIAEWDAESTARRIELHIGRDLQFIRINGTLVGGLVGVLLYLLWSVLSP